MRPHHVHIYEDYEPDGTLRPELVMVTLHCYQARCYGKGKWPLSRREYPPQKIGPRLKVLREHP